MMENVLLKLQWVCLFEELEIDNDLTKILKVIKEYNEE